MTRLDGIETPAPMLAPDAELRLVTALKCDIVESTQALGGIDPSDRLTFSRALRQLVADAARRHGGRVESWEGDGAMMVFGWPDPHEDAPECAVKAGLELVHDVGRIDVLGSRYAFRVGIASGSMAVDHASRALDGHVFNIAERLRAAAAPGCVVASDSTRRLARDWFEYEDLGMVPAKGFEAGLRGWRVVGSSAVVSRFEAQRSGTTAIAAVGRQREQAALVAAWSDVQAGRGRAVILTGEAGIGKSHLAREICARASAEGATVLEVDFTPVTHNTPLHPLGVLLRRTAEIASNLGPAERDARARALLANLLPNDAIDAAMVALGPLFGLPSDAPADVPPEALQERTVATVVAMLRGQARLGATAVICEDLHWADDTSLTVLQRFSSEIAALPVLMVLTRRPDGSGRFPAGSATELVLDPLPDADATAMVRAVSGGGLDADVTNNIVERAEGVPLIISELTRALTLGGSLESADRSSGAVWPVVPPLQLVIEARLERSPENKPLLQAASVLGREFAAPMLARLVGASEPAVLAALESLSGYGWFAGRPGDAPDQVRFSHAMVRDGIYRTLLRDDRRRLHSRVADALAAGPAGTAETTREVIAQHLREGARFDEAIQVRLAAAADTIARGAYREAEGHCEAALDLLGQLDDPKRAKDLEFRLLLRLGVALTGRHGYGAPEVEAVYLRARAACDESAEASELYPILRGLAANGLVCGRIEVAKSLCAEMLDLAEQSGNVAFVLDSIGVHCYALYWGGAAAECRDWIQRGLELYDRVGGETLDYPTPNDPKVAVLALLPSVEWVLGDPDAAEAAIRAGVEVADRFARPFDRAYIYAWAASLRIDQRRFAEARDLARVALAVSTEHGIQQWAVVSRLQELVSTACAGPAPDELAQGTAIFMVMVGQGIHTSAPSNFSAIAYGHVVAGDADAARHFLDLARAQSDNGFGYIRGRILLERSLVEPDPGAALDLLAAAYCESRRLGEVPNTLHAAALLVLRHSGDGGERETARRAVELLGGRAAYPDERGWCRDWLGRLERSEAVRRLGAA